MFLNYLTLAARTLRKRIGPTLINVTGLTVGLAACLLIGLWVERELSYDDFHPEAERIHRMALDLKFQDNESKQASTAAPLVSVLADQSPQVETATHFLFRSGIFHVEQRAIADNQVVWAVSSLFEVFGGFSFVHGARETALNDTDALVLTASTAERLFGRRDVVGETLEIGGETKRVTGVMADVPETSPLQFAALARTTLDAELQDAWLYNIWNTYVKLVPETSPASFEETLSNVVQLHVAPQIKEIFGTSFDQMVEEGARYRYFTQPLTDIHLHSNLDFEQSPGGSMANVYIFSAIALFILLIACINFTNLAMARASERATEVGIRKALGATALQVVGLLSKDFLQLVGIALVAALPVAYVAMQRWLQDFAYRTELSTGIFLLAGSLAFAVALLTVSYQALRAARLDPADTLRSE